MKNKLLSYWAEMAATITATAVIMSFIFAVYFKPEVQKMIDPLIRKIECMNYVLTKYLPPEKVRQAVEEYDNIRISNSQKRSRP